MIRVATDEFEIKLDEDIIAEALFDASPRARNIVIASMFDIFGVEMPNMMYKYCKKQKKDYDSAAQNCGNSDDADFYREEAERFGKIAEAWKKLEEAYRYKL